MKIKHIILVLFTTFLFSGCATVFLAAGTVVGATYVANDVNENHDGNFGEFMEEKLDNLTED